MKNLSKYLLRLYRLCAIDGPKKIINGNYNGYINRILGPISIRAGNLIEKEAHLAYKNTQEILNDTSQQIAQKSIKQNLSQIIFGLDQNYNSYPKSFSHIPGPPGWPIIGTLWDYIKKNGYGFDRMFVAQLERSKLYGNIYKEKIGPELMVVITDPKEYSKVVRTDSRYPRRMGLEPMIYYRKIKNLPIGLFNAIGEDWHKYRKVLNHKMLDSLEANNYLPKLNLVSGDFIQKLLHGADYKSTIYMEEELFKWAMESIGVLLFDSRLNCFEDPMPPETQNFITSVSGYTRTLQSLMTNFPWYKIYKTKLWLENEKYSDTIFQNGLSLVENKIKEYQLKHCNNVKEYSLLHHLLSNTDWTSKEINVTLIDMMMAAIETTCFAVLWTLYCLAKNPRAQEKLYQEIKYHVPHKKDFLTLDITYKMHYLKGCLKESLRLYPVVYTTSRIIENDLVIKNFLIPKKTHIQGSLYTMGRDEKIFDKPEIYIPERWAAENVVLPLAISTLNISDVFYVENKSKSTLKQNNANCPFANHSKATKLTKQNNSKLVVKKMTKEDSRFASLPWGHGSRMCIGRKISEMEIYTVLINMIRDFKIELADDTFNAQPVVHLVVCPKEKIEFKLIKR